MRKLITIGREFGAGGGEIGRKVAKSLGIEYYDKDIILKTAVAGKSLTPEQVRKWDERVPKNFGFAQSLFDFYNRPLEEEIWQAQRDAIRELANKESCVIVGRNGDYILREFDHCLRVFIHAGFEWRVKRMTAMMDQVPASQVANDVKAVDKARKRYCEHYTGQTYGDARNFDLTLDTEKLGIDKAVELILSAAETL
ncbi:MAG: cytidylate kinase-like family protein [Lachnospiraceae bacterium]|nr:cytidylate kinase-like family protein [Lachnospiraceae bacterium]